MYQDTPAISGSCLQIGTTLHQQPDHIGAAAAGRCVQRRPAGLGWRGLVGGKISCTRLAQVPAPCAHRLPCNPLSIALQPTDSSPAVYTGGCQQCMPPQQRCHSSRVPSCCRQVKLRVAFRIRRPPAVPAVAVGRGRRPRRNQPAPLHFKLLPLTPSLAATPLMVQLRRRLMDRLLLWLPRRHCACGMCWLGCTRVPRRLRFT